MIAIIIIIITKSKQHPRRWAEWLEVKIHTSGDFSHRVRYAVVDLVGRKLTWSCCQQEIDITKFPAS